MLGWNTNLGWRFGALLRHTLLPVPGLTNLSSSCLPSGVQAGGPALVECPSTGNTVTNTPGAEIISVPRWRSGKRRCRSDAGVGEVVGSSLVRNLLHTRILTAQNIFFLVPAGDLAGAPGLVGPNRDSNPDLWNRSQRPNAPSYPAGYTETLGSPICRKQTPKTFEDLNQIIDFNLSVTKSFVKCCPLAEVERPLDGSI